MGENRTSEAAGAGATGRHRSFVIEVGSGPQRVAAWRDAMRVSGRIEIEEAVAAIFRGEVHSLPLNELMATRVSSTNYRFIREPAHIERLARDYAFVNFVETGRIAGRLAGRSIAVEPGGVLLTRQGVTMDVAMLDATWFGLLLPLQLLRRQLDWRPAMDAMVFAPGSLEAVMLGGYLKMLMELPDDLSARQVKHVSRASLQFLVAHLGTGTSHPARKDDKGSWNEDDLALAIKRFVTNRLADPELGPETIGRAFSLSRSQLYRIVGEGTGIAASIRRLRLLCAHRDIASGQFADRSLVEIARRWGIRDERAFRRAFTLEFGYAPSTLRNCAATGIGLSSSSHTDAPAEIERWFGT